MQTAPADSTIQTPSAPTISAAPSRRSVRVPKTLGNSDKHSATPSADNHSPAKNMESTSISTASIKPKAKGYDLESRDKDKGKKKATGNNPKPWRHPNELPFVRHADWPQDLMMEYMRYHSFSVPPRDTSSSVQLVPILLWGSLPPTPDPVISDSSVVVWLPRGYRVPLMFIAKFQWDSLRIVLNASDPKSDWESFKFDILHLARICQHLFQEAREARRKAIITVDSSNSKAIQKAREKGEKDKALLGGFDKNWRCPSFDRLLTRFYNKWFLSTDEWLAKFFHEFDEEEYHEQDIVKHDWIRWALKGHKGFVLTKEEVQNGITAEEYMWGLTTVADRDDGIRKWVWDTNREPPTNAVSGWSIAGSAPNLASVQVKREIVEYAMARDVDHATKSKIDINPDFISRFPEITNPPASFTALSPPRPTRTKVANTPSAKSPTKRPAVTSAPARASASASASRYVPPDPATLPPPWTTPLNLDHLPPPSWITRPAPRFTPMPESSTPAVGVPRVDVDKASVIISERLLADISGSDELRDLKRKRDDDTDKDKSVSSSGPRLSRIVHSTKRGTSRANLSQSRNLKSARAPSPSDDEDDDDDDDEEDDRSRDRSYVFQGNQKKRQKTDSSKPSTLGIIGDAPSASASSAPSPSTRGSERSKDSRIPIGSVRPVKKRAADKKTSPSKPVAVTNAGAGPVAASSASILSRAYTGSMVDKNAVVLAPGTSSPVPTIVSPMSFLAKPTFFTGAASDKSAAQAYVTTVLSRETSSSSAPTTSKDVSVKSNSLNGLGQTTTPLTRGKTLPEPAALKETSKNHPSGLPPSSPSNVQAASSLTSSAIQTSNSKPSANTTASPSANPIPTGPSTPANLATVTNPTPPPPPVSKVHSAHTNGAAIPPVSKSTPIAEKSARLTGRNTDSEMKDKEALVGMDDNHAAGSSSSFDIASSNGSQPGDPRDSETEKPTATGMASRDDTMDIDDHGRPVTPATESDTTVESSAQNDQGNLDSVRFLMVQGNRAKSLHTILLLRDLLQFLRVPGWGNLREVVEKMGRRSTMLEPSPQYALLDDEEVLTADHRLDILAHASVAMAKLLFPYRGEELASKIEYLDNRLQQQFDMLWRPEDRPPMKDQGPPAVLREEKEVQTTVQLESSSKEIQTIDRDSPKPETTPPRSFASQEIQAFESFYVGEVGVQTDVEVIDKPLSLEDNGGHPDQHSLDATMADLQPAHPISGTSTTREQPEQSTSALEPATPTAQAMMSIMRNIANLLELDDAETASKTLKGKEREKSVVNVDMASPDRQSSSLVVDAIVSEFKAMKEELRQSQEKTHREFESLTAIHRTEVEALKNELRSRDNRGRDELEVIQQQHQEELDQLRETIRTMERDKEKKEEVEGENILPSLELLELRRRISSLEARARTDPTSETMGSSQAASPSVSHFSEHRQTTFHPLGHLFASEFEDGMSRVASPSSRPFVRENSTPNPGTPVSTGNPFSSRHDGMDLDESMPLPIKSQRKMHMMMFPRPAVG